MIEGFDHTSVRVIADVDHLMTMRRSGSRQSCDIGDERNCSGGGREINSAYGVCRADGQRLERRVERRVERYVVEAELRASYIEREGFHVGTPRDGDRLDGLPRDQLNVLGQCPRYGAEAGRDAGDDKGKLKNQKQKESTRSKAEI